MEGPERLPDLTSLQCFVEAAERLNFRSAAKAIGMTAAGLGQRIRRLEEQLGTPLFVRTTRRVALTPAGMALLPHAERTLAEARACVHAARGLLGPVPIDLVLGTRHELGISWILPQLARLKEPLPGVTVHLYFGSGSDLYNQLLQGQIDCAITSRPLGDPRLDGLALHPEEYVFVGSAGLITERPFLSLQDASDHILIDAGPDLPLFRYWMQAPQIGERPPFASLLRMGSIAAIHAVVRQGQGVAVLPTYLVREDLRKGVLVQILPEFVAAHDHFRLVFRSDDPRRVLFKTMADFFSQIPLR